MPFMEQVPIAGHTGSAIGVTENETYDSVIRSLREFALKKFDPEPPWRKKGSELVTGYIPDWGDNRAQSIVPQPRQGIGNPSHAGPRSQDSGKTRGDRDAAGRGLVPLGGDHLDTGTSRAQPGHDTGDARGLDQLGGAHLPAPAGRRVGPPAASKPRTAPLPGSRRRPLHAVYSTLFVARSLLAVRLASPPSTASHQFRTIPAFKDSRSGAAADVDAAIRIFQCSVSVSLETDAPHRLGRSAGAFASARTAGQSADWPFDGRTPPTRPVATRPGPDRSLTAQQACRGPLRQALTVRRLYCAARPRSPPGRRRVARWSRCPCTPA
jgi:hypothetical protein